MICKVANILPSDTFLRLDINAWIQGDESLAETFKAELEQKQRHERNIRKHD